MENLNTDVNGSNLMALLNFCTIFTALILVIPHNNTAEERVFQLFAKMRRFQTITSLMVLTNMLISKLFAPLTLPGSDWGGGGGGGP